MMHVEKRRMILLITVFLIVIQSSFRTTTVAGIVNEAMLDVDVTLFFSNGEDVNVRTGFTWGEPASSVTIRMEITSADCELLMFLLVLDDTTVFNVTNNPFLLYQHTVTRETAEDDDNYRLEVFVKGNHTPTSQIYTDNVTGYFSLDRYGLVEAQIPVIQLAVGGAAVALIAIVVVAVIIRRRRAREFDQFIASYGQNR